MLFCCSYLEGNRTRQRKRRSGLRCLSSSRGSSLRFAHTVSSLFTSSTIDKALLSTLWRERSIYIIYYYLLYYFFIVLRSALFARRTTAFTTQTASPHNAQIRTQKNHCWVHSLKYCSLTISRSELHRNHSSFPCS